MVTTELPKVELEKFFRFVCGPFESLSSVSPPSNFGIASEPRKSLRCQGGVGMKFMTNLR